MGVMKKHQLEVEISEYARLSDRRTCPVAAFDYWLLACQDASELEHVRVAHSIHPCTRFKAQLDKPEQAQAWLRDNK
jgi:hypothetical protein